MGSNLNGKGPNMSFATRKAAIDSLREFSPSVRVLHRIVKLWSDKHGAYRYSRVFTGGDRSV